MVPALWKQRSEPGHVIERKVPVESAPRGTFATQSGI
jgi:hypothetical protein